MNKKICAIHIETLYHDPDLHLFFEKSDGWQYKICKIIGVDKYITTSYRVNKPLNMKHKYGIDIKIFPYKGITFISFSMLREILKYNIIYFFSYYSPFFIFLFPFLKLFNKKIIVQYVGGGELNSKRHTQKNIISETHKLILKIILKFCNLIISYPKDEYEYVKKPINQKIYFFFSNP